MNLLHLDLAGKTARVGFTAVPDERPKLKITQKTSAGVVARQRVMNGIALINPAALTAEAIIKDDPELAITLSGRRLDVELTAAWFDPAAADLKPIGDFKEIDIVFTPDGTEKERKPHVLRTPNLNALHPVKIGRRFPMADALTGFVFRQSYQLVHEDGLTMDFLHGLAKELHDKKEAAFLGAGPKGNLPLVVREKGSPWRAFLFGDVRGDEYKLVVMLSDQELKKPATTAAPAKEEAK